MTTMTARAAKAPPAIRRYQAARATEEMREEAATWRYQASAIEGQIAGLQRRAAQAEHGADLWIACYDAEDAMDAELARRPGLDAAVEGAEAAEKDAREKKVRAVANETRAAGAHARAEADDSADPEHVDDLAERKAQATRTAAKARVRHEAAESSLKTARETLESHLREAQRLQTAYDAAGRKAETPGTAPVTGAENTIRLPARVADMSPLQQQLVRMWYAELIGVHERPSSAAAAPAARERRTTHAGFAAQDDSGFRMIRQGTHAFAIPPGRP